MFRSECALARVEMAAGHPSWGRLVLSSVPELFLRRDAGSALILEEKSDNIDENSTENIIFYNL